MSAAAEPIAAELRGAAQVATCNTTRCTHPCDVQRSATWHAAGGAGEQKRRRRSVTASGRPRRAGTCCNSAQHGCATTQPTALPIRCNSAARVATALRTTTQQPIATQGSLPWRNRTCCSAAQRVATQLALLQPTTACCNLLRCTACAAAIRPDATQHNLLQQTTVRCNGLQPVATCCSDCNAGRSVAIDHSPLQLVAALFSVCRSNPARCNTAQPVATDHSSLPWATARCNLCSDCNAVSPIATDRSQLQQTTASCNRLQR
jgi:hypothetical protein